MYPEVTNADYKETIEKTEKGILLCHKKLCPHCKNMEKVIEKFSAKNPGVNIFTLDSEDSPEAMTALGAERVPTIMIIKGGKVAATKTGLMNPKELTALYESSK